MAKEFKGVPVFGKKVANARNELVLAQEELAPKLKMTKNNLSRIEREEITGMNRESFRLFAELLGISVEEMLKKIGANHFGTDATHTAGQRYVKRDESGSFVSHGPTSDARILAKGSDPKPPRNSQSPAERIIQLALDNGLPPSAIHTASELIKQQERYKSAAGGGHREDEERKKRKGK